MSELRRGIVARAHGRVLELGAGTGLNLQYYRADLDGLTLTEPEPGMAERLERRTTRSRNLSTCLGHRWVAFTEWRLPSPGAG